MKCSMFLVIFASFFYTLNLETHKKPKRFKNVFFFQEKNGGNPDDRLDLWRGRWTDQRFGWHKSNVNEHLLKYFDMLKNGKEKLKILFPLCGKSLDLVYCYNQGHTVIGIEGT